MTVPLGWSSSNVLSVLSALRDWVAAAALWGAAAADGADGEDAWGWGRLRLLLLLLLLLVVAAAASLPDWDGGGGTFSPRGSGVMIEPTVPPLVQPPFRTAFSAAEIREGTAAPADADAAGDAGGEALPPAAAAAAAAAASSVLLEAGEEVFAAAAGATSPPSLLLKGLAPLGLRGVAARQAQLRGVGRRRGPPAAACCWCMRCHRCMRGAAWARGVRRESWLLVD